MMTYTRRELQALMLRRMTPWQWMHFLDSLTDRQYRQIMGR